MKILPEVAKDQKKKTYGNGFTGLYKQISNLNLKIRV